MAYVKQTWADAPSTTSPVNAARLNYIEDGIAVAGTDLDAHVAAVDPHPQYLDATEGGATYVPLTSLGAVNGVAQLDATSKLVPAQLGAVVTADPSSIPKRTVNGQVRGADPLVDGDLVTKRFLNTQLTGSAAPVTVATDFNIPASSTTKVDIPGLSQAVDANTRWFISALLVYDATTTADASFTMTMPTGSTVAGKAQGLSLAATNQASAHRTDSLTLGSTTLDTAGLGLGTWPVAEFNAYITVGATAGDIKLRVAQVVSEATTGHVLAGSWMLAVPVV